MQKEADCTFEFCYTELYNVKSMLIALIAIWLLIYNYSCKKCVVPFVIKFTQLWIRVGWSLVALFLLSFPSVEYFFITLVTCQILCCDLSAALLVQCILVGSSVPGCSTVCFLLY